METADSLEMLVSKWMIKVRSAIKQKKEKIETFVNCSNIQDTWHNLHSEILSFWLAANRIFSSNCELINILHYCGF